MFTPVFTRQFAKDVKRMGRRGKNLEKIKMIIRSLIKDTVLDPACGGGAFLAPVARRMAAALCGKTPSAIIRHIAEHLHGFEIDPFAAWLTQVH